MVNGGGRTEGENGLGRGCTDLLIFGPHREDLAGPEGAARFVIECKVRHQRRELAATIARVSSGHLGLFDQPWEGKLFRRAGNYLLNSTGLSG